MDVEVISAFRIIPRMDYDYSIGKGLPHSWLAPGIRNDLVCLSLRSSDAAAISKYLG